MSELVTGIDLVREQVRIAAGPAPWTLTGRAPRHGHAIDVRINAGGSSRATLPPAPGRVTRFRPPLGPGVRVGTPLSSNACENPPRTTDSMIAKLIVDDETRLQAIARAGAARSCSWREWRPHRSSPSKFFCSPAFASGEYTTGFLHQRLVAYPAFVVDMSGESTSPAVGRRQARRQALFLLYQWDLTRQPLASLFEGEPDVFARELAAAVADCAGSLDARINAASDEWSADRLGTLERNILRIGIYELEEGTVPPEVAINEAVVLAKRYATEDAARLVNGILGRVQREGGEP